LLFLLNDTVLDVDTQALMPPLEARRFSSLSFDYVVKLGQELFSEDPTLPRTNPERARRLAALFLLKQPDLNAALFVAPARGCPSANVATRWCGLSFDMIATLYKRQQTVGLDAVTADREVWRRLAA
jgi:hypothetical protein